MILIVVDTWKVINNEKVQISMTRSKEKLRILFISSDKYPPYRPAASAIFGEELVKRGHWIDWLVPSQPGSITPRIIASRSGAIYVAGTDDGESRWRRLRKHLLDLRNDLRMNRIGEEASLRYHSGKG